jgi:hypothetical protein
MKIPSVDLFPACFRFSNMNISAVDLFPVCFRFNNTNISAVDLFPACSLFSNHNDCACYLSSNVAFRRILNFLQLRMGWKLLLQLQSHEDEKATALAIVLAAEAAPGLAIIRAADAAPALVFARLLGLLLLLPLHGRRRVLLHSNSC